MGCATSSPEYTSVINVDETNVEEVSVTTVNDETELVTSEVKEFAGIKFERKATITDQEEEVENEGFGLLGFTPAPKIHRKSRIMLVDSTDLPEHMTSLLRNSDDQSSDEELTRKT